MVCNKLSGLSLFICAIGAINWGLVGAFDGLDLVRWLSELVAFPALATTLYIIVGIAGLYSLFDSISCMFSK
jgi:uncharacterized membrane protein YuzA (DUF378 family)